MIQRQALIAVVRTDGHVHHHSSVEAKIALFRSLFRGRDDVYARRFTSRKTDKSGYAPVCSNEWVAGVCEKPRIKCAECRNRRFLSLNDDAIRCHLSGHDDTGREFVIGVYPMLLDETCFFLAVDFDKADWRDDAAEHPPIAHKAPWFTRGFILRPEGAAPGPAGNAVGRA